MIGPVVGDNNGVMMNEGGKWWDGRWFYWSNYEKSWEHVETLILRCFYKRPECNATECWCNSLGGESFNDALCEDRNTCLVEDPCTYESIDDCQMDPDWQPMSCDDRIL